MKPMKNLLTPLPEENPRRNTQDKLKKERLKSVGDEEIALTEDEMTDDTDNSKELHSSLHEYVR